MELKQVLVSPVGDRVCRIRSVDELTLVKQCSKKKKIPHYQCEYLCLFALYELVFDLQTLAESKHEYKHNPSTFYFKLGLIFMWNERGGGGWGGGASIIQSTVILKHQ